MSDDAAQTTLRDMLAANLDAAEVPAQGVQEASIPGPTESAPAETETQREERLRDERGRFAAAQTTEAAPPAQEQQAQAPARPERPSSWKKEYWEHWDKLDPSLAGYLRQREDEYAKGVSTYKSEWDRAKPLIEAITPFLPTLQQHNIDPASWVTNLGRAHQTLAMADPATKVQMFRQLASQYGVPVEQLMPTGDGTQQQPAGDPNVQWLTNQVNELRGTLSTWQTAQQQREQQEAERAIAEFASKAPHLEKVRQTMAGLLQSGVARDLQDAYERAIWMDPEIRATEIERQRKESEAKEAEAKRAAAQQARAAAVSVRGATPANAKTAPAQGLRAQLSEAVEAHLGGRV